MPQKTAGRCKTNHIISSSQDLEALGRAKGRVLLETAYSYLNRQCLKERKEVYLFSKFGLFPPFSPRYRLLFRDSFSPSDISASEITGPLQVGGLVNRETASQFPGLDHCLSEIWGFLCGSHLVIVVQSPSHVRLCATPWTAAR